MSKLDDFNVNTTKYVFNQINELFGDRFKQAFDLCERERLLEDECTDTYDYAHWYVKPKSNEFTLAGINYLLDGHDTLDVVMEYSITFKSFVGDWENWKKVKEADIKQLLDNEKYNQETYKQYLEYKKVFEPLLPSMDEWKKISDDLKRLKYEKKYGVSRGSYTG